ncbi:MAG: amino acid adenylation domain-containing protein [Candidatus Omnitrophota bacterium]
MDTDIINFLSELKSSGITIQIEAGNLRVKASAGKIPPDVIQQLKARKEEIIDVLQKFQVEKNQIEKFTEIERVESKEYYPVSSAQKRLYFLQQMDIRSSAYNLPQILSLGKDVDPDRLKSVLNELIRRHEGLRTSFEMIDDVPVQRIHDTVEFETECYDLNTEDTNGEITNVFGSTFFQKGGPPEALFQSFIRAFDLSKAPLLRSVLIKMPDGNYVWILDIHHIVSDGTSLVVLNEEFATLYKGQQLPPLGIRYRDFSEWQNRLFDNEKTKYIEDYWLNLYRGEIPRLNMPIDYPRPGVFTFQGNRCFFELEEKIATQFKALAARFGGTLYMNILAALNVIYYKYTGQTDIIIGTGVAGRPHADLQRIIGMFINALAARNYPEGHKTYESFLEEVIRNSITAFENQEMQFETLVEKLKLERDPSRNPLFDVMLTVQNFVLNNQTNVADDIPVLKTRYKVVKTTTKFDMSFAVMEKGKGILISLEYYTAIYKPETIERLITHLIRLIEEVVSNPSVKLDDIDILTTEEKDDVLYRFNDTAREYPKDKTIDECFENQVEKVPDHVVLIGPSVGALREAPPQPQSFRAIHESPLQISYRELNERSVQLANELTRRGVGPDTIVAIKLERSVEMVIAWLGILKAGGAYLPIDPSYPQERIDYMLNDSGARFLATEDTEVTEKGVIGGSTNNTEVEKLRSCEGQKVSFPDHLTPLNHLTLLTSEPLNFSFHPPSVCSVTSVAKNLAYIIYTSGSTGRPKGVMIEHRHVLRLVKNNPFIDFSPTDRLLPTGAVAFDISTFEIWGPLLNSTALVLAPKDIFLNPEKLKDMLTRHHISILHLIPQLFNQIAANDMELFSGLRCFLIGGDQVQSAYINKLRRMYTHLKILHMYGPTENTVFSTCLSVEKEYDYNIPIGKPIGNSTVFILNQHGNPQPIGIAGELCVGGQGIARGYLNQVSLTNERFFSTFLKKGGAKNFYFGGDKDSRLYRSGDLGRWLEDGNIEFLGRIDHQVKIRGFRVEPGEIASRLLSHPDIHEAVVTVKDDVDKTKCLCAYIVPVTNTESESESSCSAAALRSFLAETLPDYMIPSYFIRMKALPLTANGKLDTKALPEPGIQTDEVAYAAPQDWIEERLASLWADILSVDITKIGRYADFFLLGGHSLKATSSIARIHKEFDVRISLAEFFKNSTIAGLASLIRENTESDTYRALEPTEKREYYPLSSAQKRLYVLQQMNPESTVYNMPQVIPLEKQDVIDIKKFETVFKQLIQRHESLRTSFHLIHNGEPVQRIHDEFNFNLETQALKNQKTKVFGNLETEVLKNQKTKVLGGPGTLFQKGSWSPKAFDLSKAPLIRACLFENAESGSVLMIDIHHIIGDGASMHILTREFIALYNGEALPALTLQYKDYVRWQSEEIENGTINRQETYWLNEFRGDIPVLRLPVDYPRPAVQRFEGSNFRFYIDEQDTAALNQWALQQGVTLYIVLLTLFNILLAKLSGQEDIIIGVPVAGRSHADLQSIIGMFVNTLAIRNVPKADKTLNRLLRDVKEKTLNAFENQDYQFEDLVDRVVITRDLSRNPLFDVMLALQNLGDRQEGQTIGDSHEDPNNLENGVSRFDMSWNASEYHNRLYHRLYINVEYATRLFKRETIARFASYFKSLVHVACQHPECRISDIEIMTDDEKGRMAAVWHTQTADRETRTKEKTHTAPRTAIEEKLADLWTEFIKTPRSAIGIDDSFFELGGHSLKAAQLVTRIQNEFNYNITLPKIFESPTIRQLGAIISGRDIAVTDSEQETISLVEDKEYYQLSFNQERIWRVVKKHPENTSYNLHERLVLNQPDLSLDAVRDALQALLARHESLRTGFTEINGHPVQFILPVADIHPQIVDISSLPEEENETAALEIYDRIATERFDLCHPPLIKVAIIKRGAAFWDFIWNIHHIVTDGFSQEILRKELYILYTASHTGTPATLEPLRFRYRDFAGWQRKKVENADEKEKAVRFWHVKYNEGFPDIQLPFETLPPSNDSRCITYHSFIPERIKNGLERLMQTHHYSLFMVLFSAFNRALNRLTGQTELVMRITNAGREMPEVQSLVGFFINPAVVKNTVVPGESFVHLLKRVAEHTLQTFENRWYPFELAAEELNVKPPNMWVVLNMLNVRDTEAEYDREQMEPFVTEEKRITAKFPLNVRIITYRNCIEILWEAQKALLTIDTLKKISDLYLDTLTAAVDENCGSHLGDSEAESSVCPNEIRQKINQKNKGVSP